MRRIFLRNKGTEEGVGSFFKLKKGHAFKGQGYVLSLLSHSAFLILFFGLLWDSKTRIEPAFSGKEFPVYILFEEAPAPSLSSGKELSQKKIEKKSVSVSSKVQNSKENFQKLDQKRDAEALPFLKNEIPGNRLILKSKEDGFPARSQGSVSEALSPSSGAFVEGPVVREKGILSYPSQALHQGQEGEVVLLLTLDQEGRVQDISFRKKSGWEALDAAAVENAKTLVFSPALKDGKPIVARLERTVSFRLEKKKNLSPLDRKPLSRLDYNDDDLF